MKVTITEALAEIKTINARLTKKRESIKAHMARDARLHDPLEKDGGSFKFVQAERQAVDDLEERIVLIRTEIQKSNLKTKLDVGGTNRTVAWWLNWRREVSAGKKTFLAALTQNLANLRHNAMQKGLNLTDKDTAKEGDIIVALNERDLIAQVEDIETVLGTLDGKLSLLNATTLVEVG